MSFTPSLATTKSTQGAGYPGGRADATPAIIDTVTNEGSTAIDFGIPVVRGTTGGKQVKVMTADTDDVVGISMDDRTLMEASPSDNVANYKQYIAFAAMKVGRIFAYAAENVRDGDQVLILTAGAASQLTCWGSSVSGAAASGRVAYKGARWRALEGQPQLIPSGSVAIIELLDQNLGRTTT